MQSSFYIGACANEGVICNLHESLKLPGSKTKALRYKSPSGKGVQWSWSTLHQECVGNIPIDELEEFLQENEALLQKIKPHRKNFDKFGISIICYLDKGEPARGYAVSPELMRLLVDADAFLDIDVYDYRQE